MPEVSLYVILHPSYVFCQGTLWHADGVSKTRLPDVKHLWLRWNQKSHEAVGDEIAVSLHNTGAGGWANVWNSVGAVAGKPWLLARVHAGQCFCRRRRTAVLLLCRLGIT